MATERMAIDLLVDEAAGWLPSGHDVCCDKDL